MAALARAAEADGGGEADGGPPPDDLEGLQDALSSSREALAARLHEPAGTLPRAKLVEICHLALEIDQLHLTLARTRLRWREHALADVQRALGCLHGVASLPQVLDRATAALCRNCDFDRAAVFAVEGSLMVAASAHCEEDPDRAARFLALAREHPPRLDQMLLETEILRRRKPVLVTDPATDPRTYKPLVAASKTTSYVAAPIMPEGRVIGFVHADRYFSAWPVDAHDRDTLWTFAEGLGYAIERTILLGRLHSQHAEIARMMRSTEVVMSEADRADLELAGFEAGNSHIAAPPRSALLEHQEPRIEGGVTAREMDVLELLAAGLTNAEIADRLVISKGTVKSHVKQILRKLSAANRAQAASAYMCWLERDRGRRPTL
jgi:DNA-binding CsgD family transcriptional regulator